MIELFENLNEGIKLSDLSTKEKKQFEIKIKTIANKKINEVKEIIKSLKDEIIDEVAQSVDLNNGDEEVSFLNKTVDDIINSSNVSLTESKSLKEDLSPNKLFIDLYSTGEGDWKKYYDEHDTLYVILKDEKIFCKGHRDELLDRYGMFHGTMIQTYPQSTAEDVEKVAKKFIDEIGAKEVTPEEFNEIEKKKDHERVAQAFAHLENRKQNESVDKE